jgi:hypothetical protein
MAARSRETNTSKRKGVMDRADCDGCKRSWRRRGARGLFLYLSCDGYCRGGADRIVHEIAWIILNSR